MTLPQIQQQKQVVDELKTQWKKLWQERIDDKLKAEGIATNNYTRLFIERGTIIHATRDFKALNFKEILEQHQIINAERYIPPSPYIGGWTKFIKTHINKPSQPSKTSERILQYRDNVKTGKRQPKKGGRGWLHT